MTRITQKRIWLTWIWLSFVGVAFLVFFTGYWAPKLFLGAAWLCQVYVYVAWRDKQPAQDNQIAPAVTCTRFQKAAIVLYMLITMAVFDYIAERASFRPTSEQTTLFSILIRAICR